MSQHTLNTTTKGGIAVKVIAGWDRPLAGYFLLVERIAPKTKDKPYLFNNLDHCVSHPKSFSEFDAVLTMLGVVLPDAMRKEVITDGLDNVGNKLVKWDTEGGRQ